MNKQSQLAISYAQNALSFLFLDKILSGAIERVYLFGSAVRSELDEESDIDLFIECAKHHIDTVEKHSKAALNIFYDSQDYVKWQKLQFKYPLSIMVGVLKEWELHLSIVAEGILLYSRKAELVLGKREILFTLQLPKDKATYLRCARTLFGRTEKQFRDKGLIGQIQGKRLSSSVFIVPQDALYRCIEYLSKEKIQYSFREIQVFE